MTSLPFKENTKLTMGVELELQLINLQSFDLTMEAEDFLRRLTQYSSLAEVKPEITQSMIEINSSVHETYPSLINELFIIRNFITNEATKSHIGVGGGGAHPFQKWKAQRISQTERFANVSEQYGYLAQQFTVFGQHIHIACSNGDDALYLCHAMSRYIPHFIALAASSPFTQGVDTAFDCSRLSVVSAFPLSGTPPWIMQWDEFEAYFNKLAHLGVVKSMKDFYWDIRPKPEYGTVELRICDTPLTVTKAADLAAFAQLLAYYLLERREPLSNEIYLTYLINRFRATKYGLEATIIDPMTQMHIPLAEDIIKTCQDLKPYMHQFDGYEAILNIQKSAQDKTNDSSWLRRRYTKLNSLNDIVRDQTEVWAGRRNQLA